MQILKIGERSSVKYEIDRQERIFIKKRQIKHKIFIVIHRPLCGFLSEPVLYFTFVKIRRVPNTQDTMAEDALFRYPMLA